MLEVTGINSGEHGNDVANQWVLTLLHLQVFASLLRCLTTTGNRYKLRGARK